MRETLSFLNTKDDWSPSVIHRLPIVEYFIIKIKENLQNILELENKNRKRHSKDLKLKSIQWGKNWYQFSVDLTNLFAFYLLMPTKYQKVTDEVIYIIELIIETPEKSLNYTRDSANSVYMLGTWLLSNIYKNKTIDNHPSYQYVRSVCSLPFVNKPFAKGLYRDGAFISHDTIYGWGYLRNMTTDLMTYVYKIDESLHDPVKKWAKYARN